LNRSLSFLETTANQFGYKKKLGTELAVFSLKQVIAQYTENNNPMYAAYLDASQAFNKVDHKLLLEILVKRKVPGAIINLLIQWFDNQQFLISWGNTRSFKFNVLQGVRQGGILSAYLFSVYIDDLSVQLTNTGLGCRIGTSILNHIIYADDICILSNTLYALKKLLKICNEFALNNNLEFNPAKTELQGILPNWMYLVKNAVKVEFGDRYKLKLY